MNKTAVVYFSHSGMNYAKGRIVRLEKGNTKVAAEKIAGYCGAGRSGQDIKKLCPDATVSEVLPIRGSDVAASDGLLRDWVEKILTKTGYEN